ncbi:hypothetical protein EV122DRAFT_222624 [Schizophyllum commune]
METRPCPYLKQGVFYIKAAMSADRRQDYAYAYERYEDGKTFLALAYRKEQDPDYKNDIAAMYAKVWDRARVLKAYLGAPDGPKPPPLPYAFGGNISWSFRPKANWLVDPSDMWRREEEEWIGNALACATYVAATVIVFSQRSVFFHVLDRVKVVAMWLNPALSMDVDPPQYQPYTLLRVKRKRNEEPMEGLVIESRARSKKKRGTVDLFSYAKTMEDSEWQEGVEQSLRDEVSRLNREAKEKAAQVAADATAKADAEKAALTAPPSPRTLRAQRYTIVAKDDEETPSRTRAPTSPPKVWSSKELEQQSSAPDIKMYDAVPDDGSGEKPASPMDSEIDKFIPLLDEYLKMNDIHTKDQAADKKEDGADDYVWDVFYRRTANPGDVPAHTNWATVTGLPPSSGDYDSASDSDEESDEADEDSNAEDWYANDYPEEEMTDEDDLSSDGYHETSEHEEIVRGRGSFDDDGDW